MDIDFKLLHALVVILVLRDRTQRFRDFIIRKLRVSALYHLKVFCTFKRVFQVVTTDFINCFKFSDPMDWLNSCESSRLANQGFNPRFKFQDIVHFCKRDLILNYLSLN